MSDYTFELREIEVAQIKPNPINPRGEFVRDNDDQFQYLKRSIKEFGLIVPLVVNEISGDADKKYVLLDGERRYHALKELGIRKVPAHVLKSPLNPDAGKTLMFHVHTNRVQWDAYQQCKAIEPLYEQLKGQFQNDENHVAKQLCILTGTNLRTITARLNFLRWPDKIKSLVYNERPELYYTIVEIEAQIITPALKNFPGYFESVPVDDVRSFLLNKYRQGTVHAAIEARKASIIVKTSQDDKKKHGYAFKLLKKLVTDVKYTFENARNDFISEFPTADEGPSMSFKKISEQVKKAIKVIEALDQPVLTSLNKPEKQKLTILLADLQIVVNTALQSANES